MAVVAAVVVVVVVVVLLLVVVVVLLLVVVVSCSRSRSSCSNAACNSLFVFLPRASDVLPNLSNNLPCVAARSCRGWRPARVALVAVTVQLHAKCLTEGSQCMRGGRLTNQNNSVLLSPGVEVALPTASSCSSGTCQTCDRTCCTEECADLVHICLWGLYPARGRSRKKCQSSYHNPHRA